MQQQQLAHNFSLVLLAPATFCAPGSQIIFQVPFAFRLGDVRFPAGKYTVATDERTGMLRLESADSASSVTLRSRPVPSGSAPGQNQLVFTKYGDEYFLFQAWKAGVRVGRELRMSARQIEAASRSRRGCWSNMASG